MFFQTLLRKFLQIMALNFLGISTITFASLTLNQVYLISFNQNNVYNASAVHDSFITDK